MKNLFALSLILFILFGTKVKAQEVTYIPNETIRTDYPENHIYDSSEKSAEYPGGINKFREYVVNNFTIPKELTESVRFIVTFIVEKDGSLTNIKLSNNPGYFIAEDIECIFSSSQKWTPGYENDKAVRTRFRFPLTIQF